MTVIRADILGFCAGVRRAVSAAEQALATQTAAYGAGGVYTFGPLIHNPVALSELAAKGLRVLSADEIPVLTERDTVLIRAHGVPPTTVTALSATGCTVINATYPLVTQSQRRAACFAERGYTIIFAGDKNHGEVIGIQGYAEAAARAQGLDCRFLLVRTAAEAEALFVDGGALCAEQDMSHAAASGKLVLLSQTTFSIREFGCISDVIRARIPDVKVVHSICPATHERQDALVRLCATVDGVIVIGGRNSSNTARLFAAAKQHCAHAALIECAEEIPAAFFGLARLGITAGASTPDSVIDAVEARLRGGR